MVDEIESPFARGDRLVFLMWKKMEAGQMTRQEKNDVCKAYNRVMNTAGIKMLDAQSQLHRAVEKTATQAMKTTLLALHPEFREEVEQVLGPSPGR